MSILDIYAAYLNNNVEARADLTMYVDYLNKKFNMIKLG